MSNPQVQELRTTRGARGTLGLSVRAGPVPQVPPINDPAAGLVPDDPATPAPDEPGPRPRPAIALPGVDGDHDNLSDTP